ncbi:DUF6919 domain-containing protein [Streptomyces sp. NPDC001939]
MFPDCHAEAVQDVIGSWQVTIVDPEWGRNDLLWPLLQRAVATHQALGRMTVPQRPTGQPVRATTPRLRRHRHARDEAVHGYVISAPG